MVIQEEKPLTIAEVSSLISKLDSGEKVKEFIKKFEVSSVKDVLKMKEELLALNILKFKETDIVKILDFKPQDASELNKVLCDISLSKEEVEKVLNVTKGA